MRLVCSTHGLASKLVRGLLPLVCFQEAHYAPILPANATLLPLLAPGLGAHCAPVRLLFGGDEAEKTQSGRQGAAPSLLVAGSSRHTLRL